MKSYGASRVVKTAVVLFFTLDIHLHSVAELSSEVTRHLELGRKFLQEGNLAESLLHYDKAVAGDPSNYMTYFKRAAVYLALGQSKRALPDLGMVVKLKPDFYQARLQRGGILLKLGLADEAIEDFTALASTQNSATEEAQTLLQQANSMKEHKITAKQLLENNECEEAIPFLTEAIEVSPWNLDLREMRADCYEMTGNFQSAISDIKMTTKLVSDNTAAFYRSSNLYYEMGEEEGALREIRECLRLDPDHRQCFPFYKKIKKLSRQFANARKSIEEGNYHEAVEDLQAALRTEGESVRFVVRVRQMMCQCYSKIPNFDEGMKWCGSALELDPSLVDVLCDRAELYISNEMYDEAINDYQTANSHNDQYQRIKDGLNRAQKLLKQSQKRDYYKILGVKRTASTKEINRAYRKLAAQWHPDKHDGEEKKKAEKKFYDIASAKEVLSNPEKREKFDNGEDPLDPEQQQQGFHQGPFGFPFGQGGFTFKFNF